MKKIFIFFFILPFVLFGQKVENSPYSRYGLGDLTDPAISAYRSMGYTSIANHDRFHINLSNPASLASLGTTSYEVGAFAKRATLNEGDKSNTAWSGNLDYISIGFPLHNPINDIYEENNRKYKLGMAFSLNRLSRTAYNISSLDSISEVGKFQRNYTGKGGTYKFQWANAINYGDLSFGLSLGYVFGGIETTRQVIFEDLEYAFDNYLTKDYHISAFQLNTGLLYKIAFNAKKAEQNPSIPLKFLKLGLTYTPSFGFSTLKNELSLNKQLIGTGSIITDTISNTPDVSGNGSLPGEFGFGFMYQNGEKSNFCGDIKIGTWSTYYNEAAGDKANELKNSLHLSLGGFIRPNYKSYTSFWKRAFYKYGLYYNQDPRVVLDKQITNYGLTMGVGLPFVFQRRIAHTDIGLDFGKKGSGTVIEENYFKINFGFTFNDDEWFIKRKYN